MISLPAELIFFKGGDGCIFCQAHTGLYRANNFVNPHPLCDCSVKPATEEQIERYEVNAAIAPECFEFLKEQPGSATTVTTTEFTVQINRECDEAQPMSSPNGLALEETYESDFKGVVAAEWEVDTRIVIFDLWLSCRFPQSQNLIQPSYSRTSAVVEERFKGFDAKMATKCKKT